MSSHLFSQIPPPRVPTLQFFHSQTSKWMSKRWLKFAHRHPLGLGLRPLRPHLRSLPALPRIPHRNLRPARLQQSRRRQRLRAVHRGARCPRERRLRATRRPSRHSHEPGHRLEVRLRSRASCRAHQRADGAGEQEIAGLVCEFDCRKPRFAGQA